jgi:hypothetical protein
MSKLIDLSQSNIRVAHIYCAIRLRKIGLPKNLQLAMFLEY